MLKDEKYKRKMIRCHFFNFEKPTAARIIINGAIKIVYRGTITTNLKNAEIKIIE